MTQPETATPTTDSDGEDTPPADNGPHSKQQPTGEQQADENVANESPG